VRGPAGFPGEPPPIPEAAAYDADRAADGYVGNLTQVWCWRPDVMASFWRVLAELRAATRLSPREMAVLAVAAAAARGDGYCALAWGARLARLCGEPTAAALLRGLDPDLPEREAALVSWARQVAGDPNGTTESDVDRLRRAGLGDREIFEATAFVAFRLAFGTVNDAVGARPDRQLAEEVPPLVRDAVTYGRPPGDGPPAPLPAIR